MPIRPPIAKIIKFPASFFGTLADAHAAAESHRAALLAAGNTWAVPGDQIDGGSGPMDAIDGSNSGLFIGIHYDSLGHLTPVDMADPDGTERVVYHSPEYHAPPP